MLWFAFQNDGHVYQLDGVAEKSLVATFAHGYPTMVQAWAHKNSPANPVQASLLASYVADASSPAGGGLAGVVSVIDVNPQGKQTGTVGPLSNPLINLGGTGSIVGDLSSWLGQQHIWIRAVEIIGGFMLIYLGIKASMAPRGTLTGAGRQGAEQYRATKRIGKKAGARTVTVGQSVKKAVKVLVIPK